MFTDSMLCLNFQRLSTHFLWIYFFSLSVKLDNLPYIFIPYLFHRLLLYLTILEFLSKLLDLIQPLIHTLKSNRLMPPFPKYVIPLLELFIRQGIFHFIIIHSVYIRKIRIIINVAGGCRAFSSRWPVVRWWLFFGSVGRSLLFRCFCSTSGGREVIRIGFRFICGRFVSDVRCFSILVWGFRTWKKDRHIYSAWWPFLCLGCRVISTLGRFAVCGFRLRGRIACWNATVFIVASVIGRGFHGFLWGFLGFLCTLAWGSIFPNFWSWSYWYWKWVHLLGLW